MAKMDEVSKSDGWCGCGQHYCAKCGPVALVFGVLFLVTGLGLYKAEWFNLATIFGLMFGLGGLMAVLGLNK